MTDPPHTAALLVCVMSLSLSLTSGLELPFFYPFGAENGDATLRPGDDVSSQEVTLDQDIQFYNKSYSSIYVNINGHVSFGSEVPAYRADLALPWGVPLVAVYLADVDTTNSGRIYYRSTSAEEEIDRAGSDIRQFFTEFEAFTPTSLFIVTWDRVGYYPGGQDKVNTFQLMLATDGVSSFTIMHYLSDGMQWTEGQGKYAPTQPDIPPQAGFDGGDGGYYTLPGSGSNANFVEGSNVNFAGVWMYQMGGFTSGNVRPADRTTVNVEVFDVDSSLDTCLRSSSKCHPNARCTDTDTGICCHCLPPYYGNGFSCLEPGVAQKVNGPLSGRLNGEVVDVDMMHTYVVTTDGRTYTAIPRVPRSLGPAMLTLNSIGGIIGWMFAAPLNPQARNGYHFTGGVFNRTAKVTFQFSDRADMVVRVTQRFKGQDPQNNIRMDTEIDGTLPDIPEDSTVSIDDYNENFKRTAPGVIKSFVARTYRVNDVAYRYTWDNTISYTECDDVSARPVSDVMRLRVSRHYVKLNPQTNVVRYAMTSKIGVHAGSDPCANAAQKCHSSADCVPDGDEALCICRAGYRGDGEECEDINECEDADPCDANAACYNTEGSYSCQCRAGYRGDGRTCAQDSIVCGAQRCSPQARCIFVDGEEEPQCRCIAGWRGDGQRCALAESSCNEVNTCGENARCVYDDDLREYTCECQDDFSGDGYTCESENAGCERCDRMADCVFDQRRNVNTCQCRAGYTGDGETCTMIDTCADCDRNARCQFNEDTSDYECVCVRGYLGDGSRCDLRDCREDPSMCADEGGICWLDEDRDFGICRCNYGYRGDGFTCSVLTCDVYNDCDEDAKCMPDGASFMCVCNEGFEGDGKRCRADRDQATTCDILRNCDVNARCTRDTRDGYKCRCNPGFLGDGLTCQRTAVPCNQVNNCDRNAECMYNPDKMTYQCVCSRGWEGDGVECRRREVTDCRRQPSMCAEDAECVRGTEDGYVCVCRTGFRGDGTSCSSIVREGNFLIYAQGSKIMRVTSEARRGDYGQQLVYTPGGLAVAITTDCAEGKIYWTDVAKKAIFRSDMDGSNVTMVISGLKSPEGIAVDHSGRNMYFTDSQMDVLQVARLDGSDRRTLVDTDMMNARAIVLDVRRGVIYWTDWNRNKPQIERMNMDGSERSVLVSEDLMLPNGLAFDSFSQTLCWGDAGTKSIDCIRSDGVGRRRVHAKASYPFDIAMLNNAIFWTDWEMRSIPNIDMNGDEPNEALRQAIGGNGKKYGITAVRDQCSGENNSCSLNNGGCQYLCLPTPRGGRTCECPDGVDPRLCQDDSMDPRRIPY